MNWIVGGSLVVSVLLIIILWVTKMRGTLSHYMGSPTWDFSTSWASTLTALAALLGTILSASPSVLPDNTLYLTKTQFAGLNLLFVMAITIAPLIYNATRQSVKLSTQPPTNELQGRVGWFLIASTITLWGVLGEWAVVGFLIRNMLGYSIPVSALRVFQALFVLAALLMLLYAWRSIRWNALGQTPEQPPHSVRALDHLQRPQRLKQWSVL